MNFYLLAKNDAVLSICFGEKVHLKILQSDWLTAFWPLSQEQDFSQIYDLCMNTANNKNFHYRTNSVKTNEQFFFKIQKTLFLVHFPKFFFFFWGGGGGVPKNQVVMHNFIRVSGIMPKFQRNLMILFQENTQTDVLFHRVLPATARSLTNTTAVH